jgi:hypothetical protein
MDINLLIFEGLLEQKALNFLSEIDSDIYSRRTIELLHDILKDVLNNNLNIMKIEATGNVGIALKSIVEVSTLNSPHKRTFVALVSYYAMTNHLNFPQHEKHPLLYIARAQLMAFFVDDFVTIYKEVIDEEVVNPYIMYFKPSATSDIHTLILHDLYKYKSYDNFVEESFHEILRKLSSKNSFYNYTIPDSWGESYHTKINNKVKELIQKNMPVYSSR